MTVSANDRHTDRSERLLERYAELVARLDRIADARRRVAGALDDDFAEQAVERENDEVLDALDEAERGELVRIQMARRRIDTGCFGICDACGENIDPLRLDVAPEAARCVACQRRYEEAEARGR